MSDIGAKVAHVKAARQNRDHECHWPGCTVQVAPALWGCRRHWFMLPKDIRDAIWNAYRIGQENTQTPSRGYVDAARAAQEWIALHEGELAPSQKARAIDNKTGDLFD